MAQWNKNEQNYRAQDTTNFEVFIPADAYGNIIGSSESDPTGRSSFNEPISVPITPVVQLDGIYGLTAGLFETYTSNGVAVAEDSLLKVSTSSGPYSYGVLRSRRSVRYRPGQGALARFTAMFTAGVPGYTQRAGFFAQEQAIQIGFDGDKFGVLRQNGGKAHIETLTITTPAAGAETLTITLNGVAYTANVTAGTTEENVAEIAKQSFPGWITDYCGSTISFLNADVNPKTGTYSVSSTGALVATMTTVQDGVSHTNNWTYQEDFSVDKLDGTGPSKMILDPTKLNVYQINFRWLGAGEIRFAIENPSNGDMIAFHHIHYANENTRPHLDNPSLKIGYVVANTDGVGGSEVQVAGASILGAIEGMITPTKNAFSVVGSSTSNKSAGPIHHLVTIKNKLIANEKINTRETIVKKISLGASSASSAPCLVYLFLDADTNDDLTYTNVNDTACSSTTSTQVTSGAVPIAVFNTTTGSPLNIDVEDLRIIIPAGSKVSVGISSSGLLSRTDAALTLIED